MRWIAVIAAALLLVPPVAGERSPGTVSYQPVAHQGRAPAETGKYYVVGPAVNGRPEYLFAIAAKTLGDGNRYREIFALNEGRAQPGGQTMTEATRVEPGWVLALPSDAEGPGVRTGPLPVTGPPSPSAKPSTASEPTAPVEKPPAGSVPAAERKTDSTPWSANALRIALLVLAVLLVVWAQVAIVARRRSARTAGQLVRVPAPPIVPVPPRIENRLLGPTGSSAPLGDPVPAPAPPAPAPPVAAPGPRGHDLETELASRPRSSPAGAPPAPLAVLETDVMCGTESATVRLIGVRPGRWGPAYGWLADDDQPPPSSTTVIAGTAGGRRMWMDLTMAPDAMTILGGTETVRRHARTLIAQLGDDTEVVVVGNALGDEGPWQRIASVELLDGNRPIRRTKIVVCDGADAAGLWARLGPVPHGPHRTIPVIVGTAPAARWSIRFGTRT
uniref:hypothetical protein n=1 Tax=Paractinoplanes polyasparticus TaxID=2856853 RepID=UPI001C85208A|nr:hypothetical protein [Actinoplanes polyasparticus]